ncbi:hypothetical protein V6N13_034079 [Hibiscus sabdariffa]
MRMIFWIGNHQGNTTSHLAELHSGRMYQKVQLSGRQRTQPQLKFQNFHQPPLKRPQPWPSAPCQTPPPKGRAKHQLSEPYPELPLPAQMMKSSRRPNRLKDRGDTTSSLLTVMMTAVQQYQ